MDLEYYLLCKKEYTNIINYLECIIEKYEYINNLTDSITELEPDSYNLFQPENNKNFFIQRLNYVKQFKKICDNKIHELCHHDFIEDVIDISPDESKSIEYCRICEYTKM